jgi:iron complex outermembrane receptor protein
MIAVVIFRSLLLLLVAASLATAQSVPKQATETLVVLGSALPIPLAESPRSIELLPVAAQSLALTTPIDALRADSSVFLEQRGAAGSQADLTLRGGSSAQALVLLNGFRVNDSQTSHHNLDLPLPLDAVDSIQVLHGAGSTLHGADALSGVVDFLTVAPAHNAIRLRAGAGNYGSSEASLLASIARTRASARLAADRSFSTGFIADRDYRNETAIAESWLTSPLGLTTLALAASDRSFGAAGFYGNYSSWERTRGWFASARQELGTHTSAAFAFRRHDDQFILVRSNPALYENNHTSTSWQSFVHRTATLSAASLLFGLDADGDAIASNNLGHHARNRGAGYADLDLHPTAGCWSLSVGLRGELLSGGSQSVWAPGLATAVRLAPALKLRASAGYGYRLPNYTELYYSDPSTIGNARLKPESAWSGEAGLDLAPATRLTLATTVFYSRQHDAIDYIRSDASQPWQAVNLSRLRFTGVESGATWLPARNQTVRIAWTALGGAQSALRGLQSEYVFNYPVQNVHASWTASLPASLMLTNSVQLVQRYQQSLYPVWNAVLARNNGLLRPYVRIDNASNTGYAEITGVRMQARSFIAGLVFQIGH